ncbi:uncharacterized protein sS8_2158 [Methylocaldum marinum]|uniref:Uncharacterized protein n=1 Tax=Methylocaldum marinum TaxID=1432792 RepID=A0A250KR37_9GAMM|nr:DUF3530 family protein [Methylocaldum marinum]BBA34110.1 uncharacterized protein sS8_2158 [Methylocaldum marinum]
MDMHRERQIAEAIEPHTTSDDTIRLEASGVEFRGQYRDTVSKDLRGGIILLHGRHSNQDAAELVRPLRRGLPILEILSSRLSAPADDASRKRAALKNNPF